MCILVALLVLLSPIPASAIPLTYEFAANFSSGGAIRGSFTYESVQNPFASNVRNLSPNATYLVSQWNVSVVSNWDMLPNTVFSNSIRGNFLEFCLGRCVFGSDQTMSLSFMNADNMRMRIFFLSNGSTLFGHPPRGLSEWGTFGQLDYKPISASYPVMVVREGVLTQRVPEPLSVWLLLISLVGLYRHKSLPRALH